MITAVLDSNLLLSGFVGFSRPPSLPGRLLRAWVAGHFELVISEEIFAEVARNIVKPYFLRRLGIQQIAEDLTRLATEARLTPITVTVAAVATHPEDDLILATAVSGGAAYLVTGDHQLLTLNRYQGVQIVSPVGFLTLIAS
jgi:uncharacterized protein